MQEKNCKICGKPKEASGSGSLTQFISVCGCKLPVESSSEEKLQVVQLCKICGKRIGKGREGSMTQFVFRADICECENPEPINKTVKVEFQSKSFNEDSYIADDDSEEEIEIDPDAFPVNRFKPIKKLGQGASGQVYLAKDKLLKKNVAVKILHVLTPEQLISFQEEARATSRLKHPNIVEILDFGSTNSGTPYMVLEYFQGSDLGTMIKSHGRLDWVVVKRIVHSITQGLSYSHSQGILHRDLKPSNILVKDLFSEEVQVKIIDFGIAKVSELTGKALTEFQGKTLAGTPGYMSPDVPLGHGYTKESEIYSIGCLIFEALTGRLPFVGDTALEVMSMHANKPAPTLASFLEDDIELPPECQNLVSICLEKDPGERFESMDELAENLSLELAKEIAEPTSQKKTKLKPIVLLFVLIALSVSVGAFGVMLSQQNNLSEPKVKAKNKLDEIDYKPVMHDLGARYFKWIRPERVGGTISDKDFVKIARDLKSKKKVCMDLSGFELSGKGFKHLKKIDLYRLNLEGAKFEIESLKYFKTPKLKNLILKGTAITDEGLGILSEQENLDNIDLSYCKQITNEGVHKLLKNPNLNMLDLTDTNISDAAFRGIKDSNLYDLSLIYTAVTDQVFQDLANFKRLEILKLGHCKNVTLNGVKYICLKKSNFTHIAIPFINDKYIPLDFIPRQKKLIRLSLYGLHIKDKDLAYIGRLPHLSLLYISQARITDQGLESLYGLKLKALTLSTCPGITSKGVNELIRHLPRGCEVMTDTAKSGDTKIFKDEMETIYKDTRDMF